MAGPTGRFYTPWASDRRAHGSRVDHRWRGNLPSATSADEALRLVVAGFSRSSADQFASQLAVRSSQLAVLNAQYAVPGSPFQARRTADAAHGASRKGLRLSGWPSNP